MSKYACGYCGTFQVDGFCPTCGGNMYCPKCGQMSLTLVSGQAAHCGKCGHREVMKETMGQTWEDPSPPVEFGVKSFSGSTIPAEIVTEPQMVRVDPTEPAVLSYYRSLQYRGTTLVVAMKHPDGQVTDMPFDINDPDHKALLAEGVGPGLYDMVRVEDTVGVSGTGRVAEVAVFADGTAVVRWTTKHKSTVVWDDVASLVWVHIAGHPGKTVLVPQKVSDSKLTPRHVEADGAMNFLAGVVTACFPQSKCVRSSVETWPLAHFIALRLKELHDAKPCGEVVEKGCVCGDNAPGGTEDGSEPISPGTGTEEPLEPPF